MFNVKPRYGSRMSVVQLIKHVTALPARDREKVFFAILAFGRGVCDSRGRGKPNTVVARLLPNLVLLDREKNPFSSSEAVECKL